MTSKPTMVAVLTYSGSSLIAQGCSLAGCPSTAPAQWTVTGSSYGTTSSRTIGTINAGTTKSATFIVRCHSAYPSGPTTSYTRSTTRPIPVPSAPSVSVSGARGECFSVGGTGGSMTVSGITVSGSGTIYIRGMFTNASGQTQYTSWTTSRSVIMNPYKSGGRIQAYAVNSSGSSAIVTASGTWGGKTVC